MGPLLKKLNPEKNRLVRAFFYVIGGGGVIHLATLFTLAITKRNYHYANPFYAVDLDQLMPSLNHNIVFFIAGWAAMAALIYLVHILIKD